MCQKLLRKLTLKNQVGSFSKGNEPRPMKMFVDVVPCACGKWWASVQDGRLVPCEPETWKMEDE